MDKRLQKPSKPKNTNFRNLPQVTASVSGRGKKQFRPNVNVAATDESSNDQTFPNTIVETKQEPLLPNRAEKRKNTRPPRGFDRITSVFELGVGHNAPSASSASKERISSASRGERTSNGTQENLIDYFGDAGGYDNKYEMDDSYSRGALDPITPYEDVKPANETENQPNNSTFIFGNNSKSPLLFQIPFNAASDAIMAHSGPIKLGKLQRLKSGKVRLLVPIDTSGEQEVPNLADSEPSHGTKSASQIFDLSFSSPGQQQNQPLNQIICIHTQQSTGIKQETNEQGGHSQTAVAARPASLPGLTSDIFVLGRVTARIASSVNV